MAEKQSNIKIVSISVAAADGSVFGLGEDNNVYYWNVRGGEWELHKSKHGYASS